MFSAVWLIGTSCFFFLPTESVACTCRSAGQSRLFLRNPIQYTSTHDEEGELVESNMNWVVVVVGGVFIIGALNWILNSRFHFHGPARSYSAMASPSLAPA